MSEIILKQLYALEATMKIGLAQIEAAKQELETPAPTMPKLSLDLPLSCAGVDSKECALRDGEWDESQATFSAPNLRHCLGCGREQCSRDDVTQ